MAYSAPSTRSTGDIITAAIWNQDVVNNVIALTPTALVWVFDGGGAAYATGEHVWLSVPFKHTIERSRIMHDQASTTTYDVWNDTWANFPPTNADTITGGNEPATSAAQKDEDTSLTSWDTSGAADTVYQVNVDANDAATKSVLSLKVSYS